MPRRKKHSNNLGDSSSSGSIMDDTDREVSCLTDRAFRSLCVAEEEALNGLHPIGSPDKAQQLTKLNQLNHATSRSNFLNKLSIRANEHSKWASTFQQTPKCLKEEPKGLKNKLNKPSIIEFSVPDLRKHNQKSKVSSLIRTFDNIENECPAPETQLSHRKSSQKSKGPSMGDTGHSAVLNTQKDLPEFSNTCQENYWLNEKYNAQKSRIAKNWIHSAHDSFSPIEISTSQAPGSLQDSTHRKPLKHQTEEGMESTNKITFLHSENSAFKTWTDHHKERVEKLDCAEWINEQIIIEGYENMQPFERTHTSIYEESYSKRIHEQSKYLIKANPISHFSSSSHQPRTLDMLQDKEVCLEAVSPSSSSPSSLISSHGTLVKKQIRKLPMETPCSLSLQSTSSDQAIFKNTKKELFEEALPSLSASTLSSQRTMAKTKEKKVPLVAPPTLTPASTGINRPITNNQGETLLTDSSTSVTVSSTSIHRTVAKTSEKGILVESHQASSSSNSEVVRGQKQEAIVEIPSLPVLHTLSQSHTARNQENGLPLETSSPSQSFLTSSIITQQGVLPVETISDPAGKMDVVYNNENWVCMKDEASLSAGRSPSTCAKTAKNCEREYASPSSLLDPVRHHALSASQEEVLTEAPFSVSPKDKRAFIPMQERTLTENLGSLSSASKNNQNNMLNRDVGVPTDECLKSTTHFKRTTLDNQNEDCLMETNAPLSTSSSINSMDSHQAKDVLRNVVSPSSLLPSSSKIKTDFPWDAAIPTEHVSSPSFRNRTRVHKQDHIVANDSSASTSTSHEVPSMSNSLRPEQKYEHGNKNPPWRQGKVKQRVQQENLNVNVKAKENVWVSRRPATATASFADTVQVTKQECQTRMISPSFNITKLLTPIIQRRHIIEALDDDLELITPPPGDIPAMREHETRTSVDISRENYRSKASSLLFNLKDVRKRVKSTYSTSPLLKIPDEQSSNRENGRLENDRVENGKTDNRKVDKKKKGIENVPKKMERVMLDSGQLEREAQKREKQEQTKLEMEKVETEKRESEKLEKEKLEKEKLKKDKLERERLEKENLEKEKLEREKKQKEKQENEKLEREKTEKRRLEWEKIEREKSEKKKLERQEREKLIREKIEREQNEKQERETILREKIRKERIEKEKVEKEKNEKEKLEREKMEMIAKEKMEREKRQRMNLEREKIAKEKLEQERKEKEKLEKERLEREKMEKIEREKAEWEKLQREYLEKEKMEKLAKEKLEWEKLEFQKLERKKYEQEMLERLEKEKLEREKLEEEFEQIEKWKQEEQEMRKLGRENMEKEKLQKEKLEREQIKKMEQDSLEKEAMERERLEKEKQKMVNFEKEKLERETLEKKKLEKDNSETEIDKLEREMIEKFEKEKVESVALEKDRLEREKQKKEKIDSQTHELNKEKLQRERLDMEKVEREKVEKEKMKRTEKEKLELKKLEMEKLEREMTDKIAEMQKLEGEKLEKEKLKKEMIDGGEEKKNQEKENLEWDRLERDKLNNEKIKNEKLVRGEIENDQLDEERLEKKKLEIERKDMVEKEKLQKEKLERETLDMEKQEREMMEKIQKKKLETDKLEWEKLEWEKLEKMERDKLERERIEKSEKQKQETENQVREMREKLERDKAKSERIQEKELQKREKENIENVKMEKQKLEKKSTERKKAETEKFEEEKFEKKIIMENLESIEKNKTIINKHNTEKEGEEDTEWEGIKIPNLEEEMILRENLEKETEEKEPKLEKGLSENEMDNGKSEGKKMEIDSFISLKCDYQESSLTVPIRKKKLSYLFVEQNSRNIEKDNEVELSGHLADNYLTLSSPQTVQESERPQTVEQSMADISIIEEGLCKQTTRNKKQNTVSEHQQQERCQSLHLYHEENAFTHRDMESQNKDEHLLPQCKVQNYEPQRSVEQEIICLPQYLASDPLSPKGMSSDSEEKTPSVQSNDEKDSKRAIASKSPYLCFEEHPPEEQSPRVMEKVDASEKHAKDILESAATNKEVCKEELQYYALSTCNPKSEERSTGPKRESQMDINDSLLNQPEESNMIREHLPERCKANSANLGESQKSPSTWFKPNLFKIKDNRGKSSSVTKAVKLPLPRSCSEECLLSCKWEGGLQSSKERLALRELKATKNVREKPLDLNTKQKLQKSAPNKVNSSGLGSAFRRIMKQLSQPESETICPLTLDSRCYSLPRLLDDDLDIGHLFSRTSKSKESEGRPIIREAPAIIHARSTSLESSTSLEDGLFYSAPSSESEYRIQSLAENAVSNRRGSNVKTAMNTEVMASPVTSPDFEDCIHSPASATSEDLPHFVDSTEYPEDVAYSTVTTPMSETIMYSLQTSNVLENTSSLGCTKANSAPEYFSSPAGKEESLKGLSEPTLVKEPLEELAKADCKTMILNHDEGTIEGKERPHLLQSSENMIAKPPTVPPKTEKAMRRAKRLASKRRKSDAQQKKAYIDGTEPVLTVPSPMAPSHSSLTSSVPALVHYKSESLDKDPTILRDEGEHSLTPVSQFPLTQRKLLQDPDSGQYFVVDVPVQVQLKTFFDPETGKYIQVSVPTSDGNFTQASSMEVLNSPYVLCPSFIPMSVTSLPPARSSSQLSAPAVLMQEQLKTEKRDTWGQDLETRDFLEKHPYIEPVCNSYSSSPYSIDTDSYDSRRHDIISMSDLDDFAVEGIS
ncbi:cardiac-enriched FHL2-interacting protein [Lissotriton helveticus]